MDASCPQLDGCASNRLRPDAALAHLDLGEREAIQLAQEQHADLLLIDERKGRAGSETTRAHNDGNIRCFVDRRRA